MKLDLNAKAEAVVAADGEATAEDMVVEAVAGAAVMAEAAVVAVGEGAVATAVVADAIVNSSQRVCQFNGREFFRAFFLALFFLTGANLHGGCLLFRECPSHLCFRFLDFSVLIFVTHERRSAHPLRRQCSHV